MPSDKAPQEATPDGHAPDSRAMTVPLTAAVFGVFALIAVASFLPRAQLWGVNHLAFYSVPVRLVALGLIAVSFVPPVSRRLYSALLSLSGALKSGGVRVDLAMTVIAVLSVVLFVQLRVSNNLLGDGQLIVQSYEAAWEGNDRVIMRSYKAIVTEETIAPGATLLYYSAAKAVTSLFDKGPVWGIRLFVAMLGAFFVYIILSLLRRGPFSREVRLWLMVLALFSTTIQLFFGYVENYAPLVFFGLLYVIASFLVFHRQGPLWVPIVLFVVSVYTHVQGILFGPSLVYLILWRALQNRRTFVERNVGPALTIATVVIAVAVAFTRYGRYYLPLRGDEESYGLFSPIHLVDMVNEVLMLMPILPLFAVMAWVNRSLSRSDQRKSGDTGTGATGWFAMTAEWQYVLLILVPSLVYMFLFKPEIGMARDWDLFTMTCLGLIPLALLIVNRFFRATRLLSYAGAFTAPAVVIYVILGAAWVGINASPARSTARFERILEYDKTHASYAYENLSIFYYDSARMDKAIEMMEIACDISHNPRQYVRLAMYYDHVKRREDALELMRRTVAKHPEYDKSRLYLVTILEKRKMYDELLEVARDGTRYLPKEAIYWFYFGEVSILKGNIEEGLAAHRTCLALNPPDAARKRSLDQIQKHSENR